MASEEEKMFYSQWKCENWVNKLRLTFHDYSKGPLGSDPCMKTSALVMSRLTKMRREKVLNNIFLTLGQEAQLCLPQFQRRRTDTRHVEGVGGVPGEGQSAHLVSRFVGSAPTCVSFVCLSPENLWNNRWILWGVLVHNRSFSGRWSTIWPLRPFQSSSDWTASCCDCGLDVVKIPVWVKITIISKAKIHRATPIWLYSAYTQKQC